MIWHCIGIYTIKQTVMNVLGENDKKPAEEEKEWENPLDPEKPGDARDQEQLARQLKEAKRRKDNLTDDDNEEQEHTN
jgi:hypothetical protein